MALKPNGAELAVTASNRLEYVFLVSHYRLNPQLRKPCDAFLRGFSEVVPSAWGGMFSPAELQLVLGGSDAPLDVDDWQAHATYSNGYYAEHPVIQAFWDVARTQESRRFGRAPPRLSCCPRHPIVTHPRHTCLRVLLGGQVRSYDAVRRAATLKFATSCSRPPLLGFSYLQPPFCVGKATNEEGRLPTSATCMNLLKLPPYESVEALRERLTYAIEAGAGFELS